MSSIRVTTNFKDNFGTDLGDKLITKDYLMSVYPNIAQEIGKTPELWVWGPNASGNLAIGPDTGNKRTPITTFAGGTNWKQVASGDIQISAIKTDGTLWTWGNGVHGRLGNGVTTNRSTPVTTFAGGTNWKQVSAGSVHTAAIKTDGTLWTWGYGVSGRLGNASAANRSTPVTTFAGGTDWKQVSSGTAHTAAIKTDGTLWVWGLNASGQLGINTTFERLTPITTFAGGTNWKQVSGGQLHTVAIKTDGTLWTWGYGGSGRLGNGVTTNIFTPVTTFAGGTNWKQVSGSYRNTAAIKTDGTLWLWGDGSYGRLGNAQTTNASTPITTFAGGTNWKQVSAGNQNTTAVKTDGTLWTWGYNINGELAINISGSGTNRSTPVTTFAGGTNWKQVSTGFRNNAAIQSADFI